MRFRPTFTLEAGRVLDELEATNHPKLKKVRRALGYLETNPQHPSLETHEFSSLAGPGG